MGFPSELGRTLELLTARKVHRDRAKGYFRIQPVQELSSKWQSFL
jgi:hypothetical protein